jgi:hypothetical protein
MSLQITYDEIRREVGRFLGYNRDPDEWSADATTDVADAIKSGQRNFYWPNVGEQRYSWSFLRKRADVTLSVGEDTYALATDFEGLLEGFSYSAGAGKRRVARVSEEDLLAWQGKNEQSGAPEYCALRAVQPEEGQSMRWEVVFYPTPDKAYTLSYRYSLSPTELGELNQYHLGGAAHSECVLEACLAAAEKTVLPEHGNGIHAERFQALLQASLKIDSEMQ